MDANVKRVFLVFIALAVRMYLMGGHKPLEQVVRQRNTGRKNFVAFATLSAILASPGMSSLVHDLQLPKGSCAAMSLIPDRPPQRPAKFQVPVGVGSHLLDALPSR